jgi:hypothetical protein
MRQITVEEFKDFISQQVKKEFYLGHARDFTLGFVQNLNAFIEELQNVNLP